MSAFNHVSIPHWSFAISSDSDDPRWATAVLSRPPKLTAVLFLLTFVLSDDPDPYVQDDIEQMIYSRGTVDGLRNYSFDYSQLNSDGHQVQISFSHARVHYYPSSNSQTSGQHNQFTRGPNRFNSQSTSSNVYPYDRSSISSSYHLGASRGHSHGYFTEYPRFVYYPFSPSLEFSG